MASAGPYPSLHLAPDRQPCQHPTTQFFYSLQTGCPSCRPTNSIKALMASSVNSMSVLTIAVSYRRVKPVLIVGTDSIVSPEETSCGQRWLQAGIKSTRRWRRHVGLSEWAEWQSCQMYCWCQQTFNQSTGNSSREKWFMCFIYLCMY